MSWKDVKTQNSEVIRLKTVVKEICNLITSKYLFPYNHTLYQLDFYKLLKTLLYTYNISPEEVMIIISKNPSFISYIRKRKYGELKKAIITASGNLDNRILTFVIIFYDNYYKLHSLYRAVRETMRYPLANFDVALMRVVFATYPFLRKKAHLSHVNNKLQTINYAVILVENGIREEY